MIWWAWNVLWKRGRNRTRQGFSNTVMGRGIPPHWIRGWKICWGVLLSHEKRIRSDFDLLEVHIKMEHELWLLLKIKFLLGYITWKLLFSTEIKALMEDSTAENFPWWRMGWEHFWLVQVDPPHLLSMEKPVRACWSWDRGLRHLPHTCVVLEKNSYGNNLVFFGDKKEKVLKALLTCTFITWFLNSLDLCSYGSESTNWYTLRGQMTYLGKWFAWGNWGLGGNYVHPTAENLDLH